MFINRCVRCKEFIDNGQYFLALGGYYHHNCFVCDTCQVPLSNGKFWERDGKSYCEHHVYVEPPAPVPSIPVAPLPSPMDTSIMEQLDDLTKVIAEMTDSGNSVNLL